MHYSDQNNYRHRHYKMEEGDIVSLQPNSSTCTFLNIKPFHHHSKCIVRHHSYHILCSVVFRGNWNEKPLREKNCALSDGALKQSVRRDFTVTHWNSLATQLSTHPYTAGKGEWFNICFVIRGGKRTHILYPSRSKKVQEPRTYHQFTLEGHVCGTSCLWEVSLHTSLSVCFCSFPVFFLYHSVLSARHDMHWGGKVACTNAHFNEFIIPLKCIYAKFTSLFRKCPEWHCSNSKKSREKNKCSGEVQVPEESTDKHLQSICFLLPPTSVRRDAAVIPNH